MARYDVHLASSGRGYLLDCQVDELSHLSTRAVVPLIRASELPQITRLHPVFEIEGTKVIMSTHLMFSIPRNRLGAVVANLADEHFVIMNALDLLITGV